MITPAQCRAARALLNLTQPQLVESSGVSIGTIAHFEREQRSLMRANMDAIQRALEAAGVEFMDDDGVRRKQKDTVE